MTRIAFTIPGRPFAKQRPRFSRANARSYTPAATVSFERTVATIAAQQIDAPLDGPVKLTIVANFEPAKSWSQKKRAAHMHRPHTQRPDLDNIVKAIKDGLNRVAWADDAQVAAVEARKGWAQRDETHVFIEPLGANE